MSLGNYQRLVVYLNNIEKKSDFHTTHTYKDIPSAADAVRVIWAMHSDPTDNLSDMIRKIRKAEYDGKVLTAFDDVNTTTRNGWLVK